MVARSRDKGLRSRVEAARLGEAGLEKGGAILIETEMNSGVREVIVEGMILRVNAGL